MTLPQGKMSLGLERIHNIWKTYSKKKHIKYGLPFLVFMLGGSIGLREWTQVRYQFKKSKSLTNEEAESMGLVKEKIVTVEGVYEEITKLDIDNWENKRGPRPWEDTEIKP